ncbi:conserved hypothetical protein [[Clostridium] ultunense Esp]|uniref:DUF6154 family protein n=1 Tax=Thermicanus aegyptius TaxID=94009 RepID=UPI0002B70211|nr:DUF6154 family protein [Thermicanus aegyptius]CCQ97675.1 conserved hypothetical protein [[Clostridium] ultunense Esp]
MKFVDDLFKLYRDQLTGNDEDTVEIVLSLFSGHSREDLMNFVQQMTDEELFQMISLYVVELIKRKMVEEGFPGIFEREIPIDPNIH